MKQRNQYLELVRQQRGQQLEADAQALTSHVARMEAGCLSCGTAVIGRICPDCYLCVACGPGCDWCHDHEGY